MKVAVIGSGYVGLVSAVGLGLRGHDVLAIDIDKQKAGAILRGIVPFHEPGVSEALKVCLLGENLKVSTSLEEAAGCEVILICVQTPSKNDGSINLEILKAACLQLASIFAKIPKNRTVVVRSTIIPGTTENLITPLFLNNGDLSNYTDIAFNPEFLSEGSALKDFLKPDRIVVGTNSPKAAKELTKLYQPFNSPIIVTTPSTAEMAKYTSNVLLATLISFSNEIAKLCERTAQSDVEDVLRIIHQDRRFSIADINGSGKIGILSYLKAGCGFGGSCLPKDLSALISYAHSLQEKVPLLEAVEKVNKNQSARIVKLTSNTLGGLNKRKVAVLGAAFKGGTDDLRESPGLKIANELLREKAQVVIYDPLVKAKALKIYLDKRIKIADNLFSALGSVDACVIASNSPEFLSLRKLNGKLNGSLKIIDGRRILNETALGQQDYYAIGRALRQR